VTTRRKQSGIGFRDRRDAQRPFSPSTQLNDNCGPALLAGTDLIVATTSFATSVNNCTRVTYSNRVEFTRVLSFAPSARGAWLAPSLTGIPAGVYRRQRR